MVIYSTHNNGGRAYRVKITSIPNEDMKHLVVREIIGTKSKHLFQLDSSEVFIGKSPLNPMTRFSGGYGPEFDGNAILVTLSEVNTYLHIGTSLLIFRTKSPIVEYLSPVGDNDVPYPWALDQQGNYYLLTTDVVLLTRPGLKEQIEGKEGDPYALYYHTSLIGPDRGFIPPRLPLGGNYRDLDHMEVGQEYYTLSYHVDPDEVYDRLCRGQSSGMVLIHTDGKLEEVDRQGYIQLIEDFGAYRGFEHLDIIEERFRSEDLRR